MDINLNELTLEDFATWPKPIKIASILLIGVLLLGLGYWFLLKPQYESYEVLVRNEKTLRSQFEQKQRLAANLTAYKLQLKKMQKRFGSLVSQLPNKNEMDKLLEEISRTGVASGLKFDLFDPSNEVEHDFYIELPISMVVVGTYHQLAIFLSRIAEMDRIVTLHDLSIVKADENKGADELKMTIVAKIYRYQTL